MSDPDPKDRPSASGHRFGPDLSCSECGVSWDAHQQDPSPCRNDDEPDDYGSMDEVSDGLSGYLVGESGEKP